MTEKEIENACIDFIRIIGGWVQKVHSGSILKSYKQRNGASKVYRVNLADKGTPDLLCCIKGRFLGIEVKRSPKEVEKWWLGKDERSQDQLHQRHLIKKAGGIHIIVSSINELKQDLKTLKLL